MKVAFISLGCAKNLVNTEQMMALCRKAGHTVTGDPEGADVAVLNTCGFIESAKSEAIANILELGQLKEEGKLKKLLVAGCLTQRYPDDIRVELPEVDGMLGTGRYTDVVTAIEELMAGEKAEHFGDIHRTYEDGPRIVTTPPYTAYLKIAEGCSNGCAFCIIPKLRGRYRSRSMESLLAEAAELADAGVKELIVIVQDITRYGEDLKAGTTLAKLLTELCKLDFHWIRVHYLYPEAVTDELIEVVAREKKIVKYLDIPLQHANDGISIIVDACIIHFTLPGIIFLLIEDIQQFSQILKSGLSRIFSQAQGTNHSHPHSPFRIHIFCCLMRGHIHTIEPFGNHPACLTVVLKMQFLLHFLRCIRSTVQRSPHMIVKFTGMGYQSLRFYNLDIARFTAPQITKDISRSLHKLGCFIIASIGNKCFYHQHYGFLHIDAHSIRQIIYGK